MKGMQLSFQFDVLPRAIPVTNETHSASPELSRLTTLPSIASGEKAKARDILAAIRTLKSIEQESRLATNEERQTLARFPGFGCVALSIFPDPATGLYKESWQAIGEELKSLLTPEEYASARRTVASVHTSPPSSRLCHPDQCLRA